MIRKVIIVTAVILSGIYHINAHTPAPPQEHVVAITGGTVNTVTQGVLQGGTVVFKDGVITAVGINIDIPDGAEIIDAAGKYVYPGFIHGRSILGLMEVARTTESTDIQEIGEINPNIRAHVAFHTASDHLPVAAVHGITTVVPTPRGSLLAGKLAAMMTDGWTWEDMIVKQDIGMALYWPSVNNSKQYSENMQELQDAFDKARRYKHARMAALAGNAQHHPFDSRWEAMIPILRGEMPVFITANGSKQIQAAISWAEQEQLNMVLVGSRDMGLVAPQLAQKNIPVMLTGVISGPARQWEGYDEAYKIPKLLHEAGVKFCIAGDAGAASAYRLPHHAAAAVAFGLPEEEAIKAITIHAAEILGIDNFLGSIEEGKQATLIIADNNPLQIWSKIQQVFINGRKIDMSDKHKQLFEHYMEKHSQKHPK